MYSNHDSWWNFFSFNFLIVLIISKHQFKDKNFGFDLVEKNKGKIEEKIFLNSFRHFLRISKKAIWLESKLKVRNSNSYVSNGIVF